MDQLKECLINSEQVKDLLQGLGIENVINVFYQMANQLALEIYTKSEEVSRKGAECSSELKNLVEGYAHFYRAAYAAAQLTKEDYHQIETSFIREYLAVVQRAGCNIPADEPKLREYPLSYLKGILDQALFFVPTDRRKEAKSILEERVKKFSLPEKNP